MKIPFTNYEFKFSTPQVEQKNYVPIFGNYGRGNAGYFFNYLGFYKSLQYYERIAPVATCVDIITDAVAQLELTVYDAQENQFIKDHPVLDLLSNPNMDQTGTEYIKGLSTYFQITGNTFTIGTGTEKNKPPLELFVINPTDVTVMANKEGLAGTYEVSTESGSAKFAEKVVKNRSRFYNDRGELWQVRTFNPFFSRGNLYGLSRLSAIFYEIEQYELSSIHNSSILARGARPSGIVVSKQALSDDQYNRLIEQVRNQFQGASQAGEVMVLEGGDNGLEFKQLSLTNKDMEFMELKRDSVERICNRLGVPLPLVMPDAATFNNVENAILFMYDNAILPMADRLFNELTLFLIPRYGEDPNRYKITYNPESVTALEPRRLANLEKISSLGILSINEQRTDVGKETIGPDGDTIYLPSTLLPIGQDQQTEDNLSNPRPKVKTTKAKYAEIMKKNDFSEKEIDEGWKNHK